MTIPTLDELLAHADSLPSLPEIVRHLMQSLDDERADVDTLVHHINSDPAIVARLLAAANSSAFGLSTRIDSAKQAFLVLGVDRLVSIILATALVHRYNTQTSEFDIRLFWRHTLGVATCACAIAEQTGYDPEIAYTGGLLHDIGQLLMYAAAPTAYASALHLCQNEDLSILAAETSVFGYDHAAAGDMLARAWKLPQEFSEAILAHHNPDEFSSDLADIIHVGEVLSHALDLGGNPNNQVPDLSERACAKIGISWPSFAGRFAEIEARYDGILIALGI